jgi:hypothetical protein
VERRDVVLDPRQDLVAASGEGAHASARHRRDGVARRHAHDAAGFAAVADEQRAVVDLEHRQRASADVDHGPVLADQPPQAIGVGADPHDLLSVDEHVADPAAEAVEPRLAEDPDPAPRRDVDRAVGGHGEVVAGFLVEDVHAVAVDGADAEIAGDHQRVAAGDHRVEFADGEGMRDGLRPSDVEQAVRAGEPDTVVARHDRAARAGIGDRRPLRVTGLVVRGAARARDPHGVADLAERPDRLAEQVRLGGELFVTTVGIDAHDVAALQPEPPRTVIGDRERGDPHRGPAHALGCAVDLELVAVEAGQPTERAQVQPPIAILGDRRHRRLRQAVVDRPAPLAVSAQPRGRERQGEDAGDHSAS